MARNLRGEEVGDDGLTPEEREAERQRNIAAADARRAGYQPEKAGFPAWAYAAIVLGALVVAGAVVIYFVK